MSEFKEYGYVLECKALLISISTSFLEASRYFAWWEGASLSITLMKTNTSSLPISTPFISFSFITYDDNVCEFVRVCPVNGTSSATNKECVFDNRKERAVIRLEVSTDMQGAVISNR